MHSALRACGSVAFKCLTLVFVLCVEWVLHLSLQESVLQKFHITKDGMEEVAAALRGEFDEGLSRSDHTSSVKMLITFVHSLPNGSKEEEGGFLALDLGGTNFRVLLVKIKDGKDTQTAVRKSALSRELITNTQEMLFDHIATEVASFLKEQNIEAALPLGFTFSFPVEQTSLTSGERRCIKLLQDAPKAM